MKYKVNQVRRDLPRRETCRTCGSKIVEFMDFGDMPLAGAFLQPGQDTEFVYPMQVCFCPVCTLVQIPNVIAKDALFNENYHYFSSITTTLNRHFEEYAAYLSELTADFVSPTILEFGCNDGVLLARLKEKGINGVGVDASSNVVEAGKKRGLDIICGFFDAQTAGELVKTRPRPIVITGSNVFAHNDDVENILKGVQVLLDPKGYFVVEVHYLVDLIKGLQFDFFYHEHCNYYSLHSISYLLNKFDLEVVGVQHIGLHGGSLRVVSRFKNQANVVAEDVARLLEQEKTLGLDSLEFYQDFAARIENARAELLALLNSEKAQGKRIFGYGASGRSVTLLNYMGITSELLEFMVDESPLRAGHVMPGLHIPIYGRDKLRLETTDVCLITAWPYAKEIVQKESWYLDQGKKFVVPLPHLKTIP